MVFVRVFLNSLVVKNPVHVVLVDQRDQVLNLVILFLIYCKAWMLDTNFGSIPLNIAAPNKFVVYLLDVFEIEIVEAMALSVPCEGC